MTVLPVNHWDVYTGDSHPVQLTIASALGPADIASAVLEIEEAGLVVPLAVGAAAGGYLLTADPVLFPTRSDLYAWSAASTETAGPVVTVARGTVTVAYR